MPAICQDSHLPARAFFLFHSLFSLPTPYDSPSSLFPLFSPTSISLFPSLEVGENERTSVNTYPEIHGIRRLWGLVLKLILQLFAKTPEVNEAPVIVFRFGTKHIRIITLPGCPSRHFLPFYLAFLSLVLMALCKSRMSITGTIRGWWLLLSFLLFINFTLAATSKYVEATKDSGETVYLLDERKPALYTQNFGDCLGNSLINVTRFDAAYYKDNMTVLFHLEGNSAVANESLMRGLTL